MIVIHEVPGLHPLVVDFADRLVAQGMTVFMPSLFGTPGKPATKAYALRTIIGNICIRREFNVWSGGKSSPIVDWLRALARHAHAECGGPGVGAVGMCFTGGFALAMMTEPAVIAPVLSQPSLPIRGGDKGAIDVFAGRNRLCAGTLRKRGSQPAGPALPVGQAGPRCALRPLSRPNSVIASKPSILPMPMRAPAPAWRRIRC